MKYPLKQIIVSIVFVGLAALLYMAPRGYPGVKDKEGAAQPKQPTIEDQIADVKKQLGPEKTKKITLFEAQLNQATGTTAKVAALDSLISEWDNLMRPFIAAHYSFEKSELINTFAGWFETGNRFFSLTSIIAPDKQAERGALFEQASIAYERALKLNPNDKVVQTRLAICQVEGSPNPMQGILALRKLAEDDSTNLEAQLNLGTFAMKTTQYDKAEKRFRTVVALDPNNRAGYWYLADVLQQQGKIDEAIKYFEEYKKLSADDTTEVRAVQEHINNLKNKVK